MSPSATISEATFTITTMKKSSNDKHDYGAIVSDIDLNDINGTRYSYQVMSRAFNIVRYRRPPPGRCHLDA